MQDKLAVVLNKLMDRKVRDASISMGSLLRICFENLSNEFGREYTIWANHSRWEFKLGDSILVDNDLEDKFIANTLFEKLNGVRVKEINFLESEVQLSINFQNDFSLEIFESLEETDDYIGWELITPELDCYYLNTEKVLAYKRAT